MSKGGFAALNLFKTDRMPYSTLDVGRSMLDVNQFLFCSGGTQTGEGGSPEAET